MMPLGAVAQTGAGASSGLDSNLELNLDSSLSSNLGRGRILLVLPFDNLTEPGEGSVAVPSKTVGAGEATNVTSVDWIREAAPEILNSRFTSAGFLPLSREDRLYAFDHLGLPESFQPSRATALRLAGTLDADSIIFGSYSISGSTGGTLSLKARIVDVAKLRLSEEMSVAGPIAQMIPLLNSLAWQLTRKLDPTFTVAEETFRAANAKLRVDAFEQYIRGLTEHELAERLRHLKRATELSPNFTEAWLATGKTQFANQQYEEAAVSFGHVSPPGTNSGASYDPAELEAAFYRGLALLFSGGYAKAEESFAGMGRVLPLPEVLNNEAVAVSRRNRDSSPLFRQVVAADPTDADYHFNLAVSLHRHGDRAEALTELAQALRLRPGDSEAKSLDGAWRAAPVTAGDAAATAEAEPLERIKRTFNGAAFRQAALMLDQVEATKLQSLPGPERAARLSSAAREKLDRGLLLEAEREYQAALTADDRSAGAHAGLAQVRERAGDAEAARKEAQAALDRKPSMQSALDVYLVLARVDLAANRLPQARDEAAEAVRIDGNSRAAKDLRKAIELRMEVKPAAETKSPTKP